MRAQTAVLALVWGIAGGIAGSNCREGDGASTVAGRVTAEDGQSGVACNVEINSESSPFYAPGFVGTRTGEEFTYRATGGAIEDVYVQIRCDGYQPLKVGRLSLKPRQRLSLGELVLRRIDAKPATKG